MADNSRAAGLHDLEQDAELLVLEQLDLLAQVEAQLRAVQHTMRCIEKLRAAKFRPGQAELSHGQRADVLVGLSEELRVLDEHLDLQHQCGSEMQKTVERMQQRLKVLREAAAQASETAAHSDRSDEGEPPDSSGLVGPP
jgi:hypothetical protein